MFLDKLEDYTKSLQVENEEEVIEKLISANINVCKSYSTNTKPANPIFKD